jgi:hypothetical protein
MLIRWFAGLIAREIDEDAYQRGFAEGYDSGYEDGEGNAQRDGIAACRDMEREAYGAGYSDGQNEAPLPPCRASSPTP